MKKYTFKLNNNATINNGINTKYINTFCPKYTDYSKMLDDLILDDIIEKNSWLGATASSETPTYKITLNGEQTKTDNLLGEIHYILNKKDEYDDYLNKIFAYNINLCNIYKPKKLYHLNDNIKFMILEDGILINDKMYFFDSFNSSSFLSALTKNEKKAICTIYTNGLKITIKA